MALLKQSTARNRMVFLALSSDHVSGATGLTLTITASKDGGAFASISPTVTERGNGWYELALTTGHTDTLGDLALHVTGTGADPTDLVDQVVVDLPGVSASDPWATALPGSYGAGTAGNILGALTPPANFSALSIDANGRVKAQVPIIKNQAFNAFLFQMTDSTAHTPKTGLTDADFTKKYSVDGGAAGTLSGTISEIDATNLPGFYKINLSAAELNGNNIALRFAAAGADTTELTLVTSQ